MVGTGLGKKAANVSLQKQRLRLIFIMPIVFKGSFSELYIHYANKN